MNNTQNITIVLLLVTATILGALLIGTYSTKPAYADSGTRSGRYLMVAARVSAGQDFWYVVDIGTMQMAVYGWNKRTRRIEMAIPASDLRRDLGN